MIESVISFLQIHVLPLGAPGVFFASVIEEVIAPIPSALVMTMSGFIFVVGNVSISTIFALLFKVALPAALGVTIGSYFVFFIAKYGGRVLIDRFGQYIGLYYSDIEKIKEKLSGTKKDEIVMVVARVIPIVPSVAVSALCGILGMNMYRYFLITLSGTFIRGIILGAVGWQVGNVYWKYADKVAHIEQIVLGFVFLAVSGFILVNFLKNRANVSNLKS